MVAVFSGKIYILCQQHWEAAIIACSVRCSLDKVCQTLSHYLVALVSGMCCNVEVWLHFAKDCMKVFFALKSGALATAFPYRL